MTAYRWVGGEQSDLFYLAAAATHVIHGRLQRERDSFVFMDSLWQRHPLPEAANAAEAKAAAMAIHQLQL